MSSPSSTTGKKEEEKKKKKNNNQISKAKRNNRGVVPTANNRRIKGIKASKKQTTSGKFKDVRGLLSNSAFLLELGHMYDVNRVENRRTVWVTMKRHIPDLKSVSHGKRRRLLAGQLHGKAESVCLVRASNGHKHVSTHVRLGDVPAFQLSLSNVLRTNLFATQ